MLINFSKWLKNNVFFFIFISNNTINILMMISHLLYNKMISAVKVDYCAKWMRICAGESAAAGTAPSQCWQYWQRNKCNSAYAEILSKNSKTKNCRKMYFWRQRKKTSLLTDLCLSLRYYSCVRLPNTKSEKVNTNQCTLWEAMRIGIMKRK